MPVIAEILSTGDEIRTGTIIDANASYIAQQLELMGVNVTRHNSVGDDLDSIASVLEEIGRRSDIAVVTGGLGPTSDDLTAQAAANAMHSPLVRDETALEEIRTFFHRKHIPMGPSNEKQAYLPEGSERLPNSIGTAPGFSATIGQCDFFFLPGVPSEMKHMLKTHVLPRIKDKYRMEDAVRVKTVSTFGLPESTTGERLAGFTEQFPSIRLGFRSHFPEIHVKLYERGADGSSRELEAAANWVIGKLGPVVFSTDELSMEEVVGELLRCENATLAVAESCTGGLIANWITNISGSSDYFLFSGVTYSNEAKIRYLGVSPKTLEKYGAVSTETAAEMAEGAKRMSGATYAISTSGIAGPSGGSAEKPVGTVCIGLATPQNINSFKFVLPSFGRTMNKRLFAMKALDILRLRLSNLS